MRVYINAHICSRACILSYMPSICSFNIIIYYVIEAEIYKYRPDSRAKTVNSFDDTQTGEVSSHCCNYNLYSRYNVYAICHFVHLNYFLDEIVDVESQFSKSFNGLKSCTIPA